MCWLRLDDKETLLFQMPEICVLDREAQLQNCSQENQANLDLISEMEAREAITRGRTSGLVPGKLKRTLQRFRGKV